MDSLGFDPDAPRVETLDPATADRLLGEAARLDARSRALTDFRAHAMIQGWTAAALFVYVLTYLLLIGNPAPSTAPSGVNHTSYVNVLIIPFLAFTQLVQGARNRLPISFALPLRGLKLLLALPSVIILLAAATAVLVGINFPWWVSLLVATLVVAPVGVLAISTARKAGGAKPGTHSFSPRPSLGRTAAGMTTGLGVYFGVIAAVTPYRWFPAATMIFIIALLVPLIGLSARWGLPSVGADWRKFEWVAFGMTIVMSFALTILATKTDLDTPLVATISGILIAAPLVCSGLRTHRQHE